MENNDTQSQLNEGGTKRVFVVAFWVIIIALIIVALAYVVWQRQGGFDGQNDAQQNEEMTSEERAEALDQIRNALEDQNEEPTMTSEERAESIDQIKEALEGEDEEPTMTPEERAATLDELREALSQ